MSVRARGSAVIPVSLKNHVFDFGVPRRTSYEDAYVQPLLNILTRLQTLYRWRRAT